MKVVLAGGLLTATVAVLLWLWQGEAALAPALLMGGVATLIELLALRALQRGLAGEGATALFKGFGVGLVLRTVGVAVFLALALWDRDRFPPLATGLGYVGVVIPLLFLEARFIR